MQTIKILSVLLVALGALACSKSPSTAGTTATGRISPDEAERIVREFAMKESGREPNPATPPSSLEEIPIIIEQDQVSRFEPAIDLLAETTGFDALVKRSTLELLYAEMHLGVAYFFDEMASEKNVEISLFEKLKDGGTRLTEKETARQEELGKEVRELGRVANALRKLAAPHTGAGATLADEAIRRQPQKPDGYRNAAFAFALKEEWREFDKMRDEANRLGAEQDFAIRYLTGIENIRRLHYPEKAREFFEGLSREFPSYVRVQARLVFLYEDIESTYKQMQRLKSLSPNHPIVRLAGATIEDAYQSAKALETQP